MNEKLAVIRQACIKANPEIVELKEGSVVLVANLPHTIYGKDEGIYFAYLNKPFPKELEYNDFYDCQFSEETKSIQILGRPIRLADVLLAIEPIQERKNWYSIGNDGQFYVNSRSTVIMAKAKWNLCNDDLTQQSQETINFLYDLLK